MPVTLSSKSRIVKLVVVRATALRLGERLGMRYSCCGGSATVAGGFCHLTACLKYLLFRWLGSKSRS